jgi:Protein of unknown function (DUF2950)
MAKRHAHRLPRPPSIALLLAVSLAMVAGITARAAAPSESQESFATPQQAVDALVSAARTGRTTLLARILGPDGAALIRSGDPVADRNARRHFIAAYDRKHGIERRSAVEAVLTVGAENWPLPIPLVRAVSGWRFDTAAGRQEILDRRIGRNELAVIQACRAYVQAQREYAALAPHARAGGEYAQHFMSRSGRHDGLYWPVRSGERQSPLGPLVAQARARGYAPGSGKPHAYYGYRFRILTAQGAHAPGGARNYLTHGRMTGGFALLAYPAEYGDSGIMTFIVDQDGIVFGKNLGPATAGIAAGIEQYDPEASWSPQ